MGGTAAKPAAKGRSILLVDLCNGEPARHGEPGERTEQANKAASILGVDRYVLPLRDRLIRDTREGRLAVARLIRMHQPWLVFTTAGSGIHPDHQAVTDIMVNGVFYARLPKWEALPEAEVLDGTNPHEIQRLFFGHCRMELPWPSFDFAVEHHRRPRPQIGSAAELRVGVQRGAGRFAGEVHRRRSIGRQPGRRALRGGVQGAKPVAGLGS